MSRSADHSLLTVAALICLCFTSGCGSENTDKKVSFKSGGMTHTIAEGVDSVPKDFALPVYPGATTSGSVSAGDSQEQSEFLMLTTPDPMDKVSEFYQDKLRDGGFSIDKVETNTKLVSIEAHKDKLQANAEIADDSGKTTISLQWGKGDENVKDDSESSAENFKPDKVTPPTD